MQCIIKHEKYLIFHYSYSNISSSVSLIEIHILVYEKMFFPNIHRSIEMYAADV